MEKFKFNKEYPIGKELLLANGTKVRVTDNNGKWLCDECAFVENMDCNNHRCLAHERSDKRFIIYKPIEICSD